MEHVPKFVWVVVGIVVAVVLFVYVALPVASNGTCVTFRVGCRVSTELWPTPNTGSRLPARIPVQRGNANRVGEFLHRGCPAGVQLGQVFACSGPTGQCICK